jgi:hypothetical protein
MGLPVRSSPIPASHSTHLFLDSAGRGATVGAYVWRGMLVNALLAE